MESSEETVSYVPTIAPPPLDQKPGSFLSAFYRFTDTVSLDHSQRSGNVPRWVWVSESPGCGNRELPLPRHPALFSLTLLSALIALEGGRWQQRLPPVLPGA